MINRISTLLVVAVLSIAALAISACSPVRVPLQQAAATAMPVSTDTATPVPTTPPAATKSKTQPAAPTQTANPLAAIRRFGLEAGIVEANNGDSLSLRLGKTSQPLTLTATTTVIVPGISNARTVDIKVGDRVIAHLKDGDTNSPADMVLDLPRGFTAENVSLGLVQSNATGALSLRTRTGTQDVTIPASATVLSMLAESPKLASVGEVTRGQAVLVIGQKNGDQLSAQVVVLLDRAAVQGKGQPNRPTPVPTPR